MPGTSIFLWGQMTGPEAVETPLLALRRWFESLTLSSPEAAPSSTPLAAWLLGLLSLLILAVLLQGPRRALGQLVDIPGHVRILGGALWRLRNAGRAVAVLVGTTVLAWTTSQFPDYADPERLADLYVFTSSKTLGEIAFEQGILAALTPLRDICGLADVLILLVGATILVFKLSADRWGGSDDPYREIESPLPRWTTLCWGAAWLFAMYRFASLVVETGGLPLGGCLVVEAGVIPLLMAMSDGILLAWLLVELRSAGVVDDVGTGLDVRGAIALWPAATLACVLALPARYVAAGAWLLYADLPNVVAVRQLVAPILSGWGLVLLQGAALVLLGTVGAAAWWGHGGLGATRRGFVAILRANGGRLLAMTGLAGVVGGALSAASYAVVLSLPRQPWVLTAADSYAHYGTLVVGLIATAVLVELGSQALPRAALATASADATTAEDLVEAGLGDAR